MNFPLNINIQNTVYKETNLIIREFNVFVIKQDLKLCDLFFVLSGDMLPFILFLIR